MKTELDTAGYPSCRRNDRLTAQRIDVGLVFLEMCGAPDAADYLVQYKIPAAVTDRVLSNGRVRRRGEGSGSGQFTGARSAARDGQ